MAQSSEFKRRFGTFSDYFALRDSFRNTTPSSGGGKCLIGRVRLPAPSSGMMIGIIGQQSKRLRNSAQAVVSCEKNQLSRLGSSSESGLKE